MVSAWPEPPNVKLVGVHDGMERFALVSAMSALPSKADIDR